MSVEGNRSEINYFQCLDIAISKKRFNLSLPIKIKICPLCRTDTKSAPQYVIELLEEYIEEHYKPDKTKQLFDDLINKYSEEKINLFINDPDKLLDEEKENIEKELLCLGLSIEHEKYLSDYQQYYSDDIFAIVIDRDRWNNIEKIIELCKAKKYNVFLSNPCFELWLLLHLIDPSTKYTKEELLENRKVNRNRRFISKEISEMAGHNKCIKYDVFEKHYLPNIQDAIDRAKQFETKIDDLVDNLGTNVGILFEMMQGKKENMW